MKENLRLSWDLARSDLNSKYRRSILGIFWLVLTPLCLLGIYSIVFGFIFGVEWKVPDKEKTDIVGFTLPFFVGLTIYLTLADVVNSSTVLFSSKRTYVVKSPFPLWVLWLSNLMRASVHLGVSLLLVIILAIVQQRLTLVGFSWMILAVVVCLFFISSLSLLLVSLGPFIGDISDALRLALRVLFYATPITYPIYIVPEEYRSLMWFNPLTCMVELLRNPIVFGLMPSQTILVNFIISSIVLFGLSYVIFKRVKGVISDVV
jgi:lipopolysaccharide transport system permease protein